MNNAAGSNERAQRRFHGHMVSGPLAAMTLFSHLDSATQSHLFREAQHYGTTQVMLDQVSWELAALPNHTFDLRLPGGQRFL